MYSAVLRAKYFLLEHVVQSTVFWPNVRVYNLKGTALDFYPLFHIPIWALIDGLKHFRMWVRSREDIHSDDGGSVSSTLLSKHLDLTIFKKFNFCSSCTAMFHHVLKIS